MLKWIKSMNYVFFFHLHANAPPFIYPEFSCYLIVQLLNVFYANLTIFRTSLSVLFSAGHMQDLSLCLILCRPYTGPLSLSYSLQAICRTSLSVLFSAGHIQDLSLCLILCRPYTGPLSLSSKVARWQLTLGQIRARSGPDQSRVHFRVRGNLAVELVSYLCG